MKKIVSYVLVVMILFTSIPNVFAATDFNLVIGDSTSYEIKTGETINVPVYIEPTSAESVEIAVLGFHVSVPEGFTATVTDGILKAKNAEIFVNEGEVVLLKSDTTDYTKTSALCTINYTATSAKAGKYDLKLIGEDGDNMAAQMDENFDEVALSFDVNAPSITVIEDAAKTITSIDVTPSEITVPYDKQDDIVAFVKESITGVTATYSDNTKANIDKNDCSITVSENVATVTYEGVSATINLKLESKPPVSEKDFNLIIGDSTSYEVKTGETINVPVYIEPTSAESIEIAVLGFHVSVPEGFTATVTDGILKAKNAEIFVNEGEVVLLKSDTTDYTKTSALCTINYTATSAKAGKYDLKLIGEDGDNMAAQMDENFDEVALSFDVNAPSITVIEDAAKTITSIDVTPSEITVPYDKQDDIVAFVKESITGVTATYSDNTKANIDKNDCSITVSENVATVTYEGVSATINLKLESKPPVSEKDFNLIIGDSTSYEVKTGETINVPVYIEPTSAESIEIAVLGFHVSVPEGFTATVTDGILKAKNAEIFVNEGEVVLLKSDTTDYTKTSALCTINYTATSAKAGKYDLKLIGEDGDNMAAQMDENFDEVALSFDVKAPSITVVDGGSSEPTLTGISVNPDEVMVPYNQDVAQVIGTTNFSVTAFYDDETSKVLDRLEYDIKISDDGNTATVSYQGKTAAINIKYQPTPVLTVEKSEITVPYGTEDVEAYVKAEIKSGKVKLDETDLTFDDYVIEFTNGADTATVKYADDATITATVNVTYVTLTGVTAELNEGVTEIVLPWSIPDGNEAEAIKAYITVKAQLSNNTTVEIDKAGYDVVYDAEKGEFYVTYGGLQSNVLKATKGTEPAAEVTGITISKDTVNVPYGKTDEQIIAIVKGEIVVTATYDKGEPSDIAADAYDVTIADDKATITYEGFTADVTLVKETRKLELSNTEITVDEGTDKDGIIAYVKANVTAKYVYSQTTAEQTIPADELAITVNDELTEVTVEVGGESAKIAVNIKVVPNFIETVKADTNAYGIATAKLVVFTDVKDGKVVKVTDEKGTYDAIYMGNGKWAAVVTGSYTAFADNGSLPEAAKFGRLHDASMITAYDALLTLLKANNGAVNVFDNDYQKYLLADVDGNGTLTADEALYINRISLGNADESTLWFNK